MLGCLLEKQRTTPDVYPLSLNSLRLACNQATNREPVVDYDEVTVRAALERLSRRGWARLRAAPEAAPPSTASCSTRPSALPSQTALLAVLMLRGPQTPGELKARAERLYPYGTLEDVQRALEALIEASSSSSAAAPPRPEGGAVRTAPRRQGRDGGAGGPRSKRGRCADRATSRSAWGGSRSRSRRSSAPSPSAEAPGLSARRGPGGATVPA